MSKHSRAEAANKLITIIGSVGRQFFYSTRHHRFAQFRVSWDGTVIFIDDYSGRQIKATHRWCRWRGFTHGGTLQDLCKAMADFIRTGKPISAYYFGPWPDTYCRGDLWGYGIANMASIREQAIALGVAYDPDVKKAAA